MAAVITAKITVTESQLPLVQDAALEAGKTIEQFVSEAIDRGQNISSIANDRAIQAFYRLQQAGTVPAEILAESRRVATAKGTI
jgi:hypothetical protein